MTWSADMGSNFPVPRRDPVDEVVTHDEVLRWQPEHIRREWAEAERAREMALPPEERGWATEDEVAELPGEWIAVHEMGSAEVRYLRGWR